LSEQKSLETVTEEQPLERVSEEQPLERAPDAIETITKTIDSEFQKGLNEVNQITKQDFEKVPQSDIGELDNEETLQKDLNEIEELSNKPFESLDEYKKIEDNLIFNENLKEDSNNDISSLKKEEYVEKEEKTDTDKKNEEGNKIFENLSSLSESVKQGFENVLKAIQENKREQSDFKKETKDQEIISNEKERASQENQEKPKNSQKNFIEEYRESLRTNHPINGYVGIKNLDLKVNNIGSYI
jgi:hypothetical protein